MARACNAARQHLWGTAFSAAGDDTECQVCRATLNMYGISACYVNNYFDWQCIGNAGS